MRDINKLCEERVSGIEVNKEGKVIAFKSYCKARDFQLLRELRKLRESR